MKKRISAWKRRRGPHLIRSKGNSQIQQHHGAITSAAPMHFHFSNSNCSFLKDAENGPDATVSMPNTALTGCDLTFMSSTSTYSGSRSTHARQPVDAPGFINDDDIRMHNSVSNTGITKRSRQSSIRKKHEARMLSPSRVLIKHTSAPEWPPCSPSSSSRHSNRGFEQVINKHDNIAQLLSPSRVLIRHGPDPEWPPSETTCVDLLSAANNSEHGSEKENNTRVAPNHFQKQFTTRHSNAKASNTQQIALNSDQLHLYSDGGDSFSSNPPPNFHPRKEIVNAIKCHEKMGKALSKLILSADINNPNANGDYSFTSTTLSGTSTFESFETNSFCNRQDARRPGAIIDQRRVKVTGNKDDGKKKHTRDNRMPHIDKTGDVLNSELAFVGESNSAILVEPWGFSGEIEWSDSGFSKTSNRSIKSDTSSFFQHVAFLEGLEDRLKELNNPKSSSDQELTSDDMIEEGKDHTFFPTVEDLRSPPSNNALLKSEECFSSTGPTYPLLKTPDVDFQDDNLFSPPGTPACLHTKHACIDVFPSSHDQSRLAINEAILLKGIAQIKEETSIMLKGMESKLKIDLKELMETELVKNKSHIASQSLPPAGHEESTFSKSMARFSSSSSSDRNVMTPQPQRTTMSSPIDRNVLSEILQKSLNSMESSILDKITLHMDTELRRDSMQQYEYLDELIDEKVTQVVAGQNLELQMGLGEIKRAMRSAAVQVAPKQALECTSLDSNNGALTPKHYFTPAKCKGNDSPSSDIEELPIRALAKEPSIRELEDSFAETMKVIDDFVADCDHLVGDFDKIAFRMEDSSVAGDYLSTAI